MFLTCSDEPKHTLLVPFCMTLTPSLRFSLFVDECHAEPAIHLAVVMRSSRSASSGQRKEAGGKRYSAAVEKGENAWQREWQGFISGVKMTDGGAQVKLPSCMDHEQSEGSTFSYLFNSSSAKKSSRDSKAKKEKEEQKRKQQDRELKRLKAAQERGEDVDVDWDDPFGERSKHQKTMLEAQKRGLKLDGMSRKQVREFLHLTISKEQEAAMAAQKELKPHELMDEKLQWYQQGPYPLDVISEKLVIKKAVKHAKQNGMRYNYLTVHPSWVASRARKRREETKDHSLAAMGIQITFNDDGIVEDTLRLKALQLASQKSFLERNASAGVTIPTASSQHSQDVPLSPTSPDVDSVSTGATTTAAAFVGPPNMGGFRKTLQSANLSTTYITSSFIHGPSLGIEDMPEVPVRPVASAPYRSTSSNNGYAAQRKAQRDRDSGAKTIVIPVTSYGGNNVDPAETVAKMRRAAVLSGAAERRTDSGSKAKKERRAARDDRPARKDTSASPKAKPTKAASSSNPRKGTPRRSSE